MVKNMPVFDSRDSFYRSPFGAVHTGTVVKMAVTPPLGLNITHAAIVVNYEMTGRQMEIPLLWEGHMGSHDLYRGEVPTEDYLGPLWYCFRFLRNGAPTLYCGNATGKGGVGELTENYPNSYQITVYDAEATNVPKWYGQGITYHIFPDRFRRVGKSPSVAGMVGDRILHENWDDTPNFLPDEHGEIRNRDFFGGNLAGVEEKLPYLASLGVRTIYFSPIFEAASNHRYDTADYRRVDPLFGDEKQFSAFCKAAGKLGLRIILDGVFNHTGFDSVYFNGRGTYPELGAFQSRNSEYYSWFDFVEWPHHYSAWWGIYTLPQINESHPDYLNFVVEDEDSVVRHWLRLGASGWRLDVVDELPDAFVEKLHASARKEKEDAVLIGEVWEDASNKIAYSVRRKYLLGRELDGVMNYPFRDAIFSYLLNNDAASFRDTIESLRENYPRPTFYSLMNIVGTHDTPRVLTVLGAAGDDYNQPRTAKATFKLSPERRAIGTSRLKIASAIQFCFPGSPCILYGDEAGLEGFEDPFNRRTYPWGREDQTLLEWYRKLGALRIGLPVLQDGELTFLEADGGLLVFERTLAAKDATSSTQTKKRAPDADGSSDTLAGHDTLVVACNAEAYPNNAEVVWDAPHAVDLLTGKALTPRDGRLSLSLPPHSVLIIGNNK